MDENERRNEETSRVVRPVVERPMAEIRPGILRRISWGAVFAGVIIALVVQLLLTLLGMGIGFGVMSPTTQSNPFAGLGTGALVWWVVSMLIALFAGGLVSGRLAGVPKTFDGVLHGLLSFSLFTLFTFYLLTTAVGSVIGGVGSLVGQTLSLAGKGAAAAAPYVGNFVQQQLADNGIDLNYLKREANQLLRETGKPELQPENLRRQASGAREDISNEVGSTARNPQNAGDSGDNIIDKLFSRAGKVVDAADRDAAVNVVMNRTGKSRQESEQIVDNWIASYNQTKAKFEETKVKAEQTAREAGESVASAVSKASIFAFIGLLLGAVASAFGGNAGRPKNAEVQVVREDKY